MSFELKHSESPGESFTKIVDEEIDSVVALLKKRSGDLTETVHETRKSIKKIRAIIRLMRGALGEKSYRLENLFFRDVGHQLSDARDAQILLDSVEKLRGTAHAPTAFLRSLEAHFRDERDAIHALLRAKGVLKNLSETLDGSRKRIQKWPNADWDDVAGELKRSYKRGRDTMETSQKKPTFENYHAWRKRAKDLYYQSRLLNPIWPESMQLIEDQTHTLSDKLGDDHDLGVLQNLLKQKPAPGDIAQRRRLLETITQQQELMRVEAKKLGDDLYQDRPKEFVARLEALYAAW